MPNWAFVDYKVIGDEEGPRTLYQTMKGLEEREVSLVENGFGKTWLGNLVAALGGDPEGVECRGKWNYVGMDSDGVYMSVESALREQEGFRLFLEERFPGIKIYFQSVGDGFWQTNDEDGLYFSRYYLYTEDMGEDYYDSLEEVIVEVQRITGKGGLKTIEECGEALELYSEENGECEVYVGEFEILV